MPHLGNGKEIFIAQRLVRVAGFNRFLFCGDCVSGLHTGGLGAPAGVLIANLMASTGEFSFESVWSIQVTVILPTAGPEHKHSPRR
jgi:hypothetical protein